MELDHLESPEDLKKRRGKDMGKPTLRYGDIWNHPERFPIKKHTKSHGTKVPLGSVLSLCCMCGLFLL